MARPLRLEFPGALYHVTVRGNERRPIFFSDTDRLGFLKLLGEATARFGWSITAWVLMTNHFHLVVQTPEPNLSRGMHWLNGKYASWINRKHRRCGHLFQGRFHSVLIEKDVHLAEVLRYVALNPVRAGIVPSPEAFAWSSYRMTVGLEPAPSWFDVDAALAAFGSDTATAQVEYRAFVLAKVGVENRLWDNLRNSIYLGSEEWAKTMRRLVESKPRSTDHPKAHRAVGRPTIQAILGAVARIKGMPIDVLRGRGSGPLRWLIAWIGWHEGLVTLRTIAAALRLRSEGYVSTLIRRCENRFSTDRALLATLDDALAALRG